MKYESLYSEFKIHVPDCIMFCKEKEDENAIDDKDGMHVIFGMVVVPYILKEVENSKANTEKIFAFLEKMAVSEDIKVTEVLEFTVLESLIDEGPSKIANLKRYMLKETLKSCLAVEEYFYKDI